MNLSEFKYKANYYAILLLAFVIPLERKLTPPLIILFFITSIFNYKNNKDKNINILFFSILFVLYLIGVTYSSDINYSLTIIVEKLSLVIFPVAMYLSNIDFKKKLFPILFSFIEGCFISSILSVIASGIGYYFNHDSSLFFYGNISNYLHSSYFAMYLSFGLIIIYYFLFNPSSNHHIKKITSLFLLVYFSVYIILLSSKTGLISLLIIHSLAILFFVLRSKSYLKGIAAILLVLISFLVAYQSSSVVKDRINELVFVVNSGDTSDGSTTGARVEIWKIAANLISQKPWIGYGTGNVTEVLTRKYEQLGFRDFANKHLNAHNQFLQTTLAIGLIGGITLLLLLVVPIYLSLKTKAVLYLSFLLLVVVNFLTEAMLERQTGVVFYALFNCLLYTNFVTQTKTLNSKNDTIFSTTH